MFIDPQAVHFVPLQVHSVRLAVFHSIQWAVFPQLIIIDSIIRDPIVLGPIYRKHLIIYFAIHLL